MGGLTSSRRGTPPRPFARGGLFLAWALDALSKAPPLRLALVPLVLLALLLLPTPSSQQQGILYVNDTDPTCQGQSLCYDTIQAAVDAAGPGQTLSFAVWFQVDQDGLWRLRRF